MTASLARSGLVLFFTPGVTVKEWASRGFLSREVLYYERLAECAGPVVFVSEGTQDGSYRRRLGGIRLLANPAGLPGPVFRAAAAVRLGRSASIVKTNQFSGLIGPLIAKLRGAKVVARGGYVRSEPWWHRHRLDPRRLLASLDEAILCWIADLVFVTSPQGADYLRRHYRFARDKIIVLPNFVDVVRFSARRAPTSGLITMVGRLSPQKNVLAAVEAVAGLAGASLRIVGDGPLRHHAEAHARDVGANVEFVGSVPHDRLPALLAETDVYLHPSLYEGHPKSLIEAMAAGAPIVAAPSPGVNSLIRHLRTGYLSEDASPSSMRAALETMLGDSALREELAAAARREAIAEYSIDSVLARECAAYRARGWVPAGRP